jgi:hypothetical protein
LSPSGCHAIATPKGAEIDAFTRIELSPTGTEIAIAGSDKLRTIPVDKGTPTSVAMDQVQFLYRWDADGIQLHDLGHQQSRARPGHAPEKIDRATAVSPDERYAVVFARDTIDVIERGKTAIRTFTPAMRSDLRAIERAAKDAPAWFGPHGLVLSGSPDVVLDVATLKTRPLLEPGATFVCGSADGAHALLQRDDRLYGAR